MLNKWLVQPVTLPPPAPFPTSPSRKASNQHFLNHSVDGIKAPQNPHSSQVALQHAELTRGKHGEILWASFNYRVQGI